MGLKGWLQSKHNWGLIMFRRDFCGGKKKRKRTENVRERKIQGRDEQRVGRVKNKYREDVKREQMEERETLNWRGEKTLVFARLNS